ncbi:ribonuclease HII [Paeniglutamicibacter cryotolerans]|uniref:Ribonuclease n=1 Tax=Paeniglutamicibacter cryotolerans TaxID=670079 RepID=A0A839QRS2_9MICC|nr:ribonuclease HII [Paeniglutamicibacter cryotolerans]MBB2997375.1 ribonuclease HII [Paeniglutamicibacter cryotolerans]
MAGVDPTLELELELAAAGYRLVGGCDEVGRGSLAGPVSVGFVVIDPVKAAALPGVRDSKLVSAPKRLALVPQIKSWALAWGVGHSSAAEIDAIGLVPALRLAGRRAWMAALPAARADTVLLDGNLNWFGSPRQPSLMDALLDAGPEDPAEDDGVDVPVRLAIKGDLRCLSVAAASILAKVERDALMDVYDGELPAYGWSGNKGYGTAAHREAIEKHGATGYHRKSWRLTASQQG